MGLSVSCVLVLFLEGAGVSGEDVATGGEFQVSTTGGGLIQEDFSTGGGFIQEERTGRIPMEGNKQTPRKPKHPTIFYATRTHSQITQVIREYRKTSYRVPMAVLGARKHYCTNKQVCKKKNIDEECKLLLKDSERSCFQFKNVHKVKNHSSLQKGGAFEIHDIEDLVGIGNSVRGCAYFASRSLALDAGIVFCPYGYLLNPVIRKAMEINLDGAIIILDEAHNIEDVAREAGSIDVETGTLEGLRMELEQLSAVGPAADFYHPLLDMVQEMLSWIYKKSSSLEKQDFERYSSCWFGEGALQELEHAGIQSQGFTLLAECAKKAVGAAAEAEGDGSHLSGFAAGTLEGIFSVLNFMLKDNGKHLHDYRLVVQKYVKRDAELGVTGWVSSLGLWCLNPAVVFEEVASKAQSIILTSGTLSPIGSFASELGVTFEVCMEAPHVIDMKTQVWAASLSKGLSNVPLNASYKHADGYAFQDALGKTLEEIFKVTPDGALVFFPSYKLLEKLCDRWKATDQWNRLYESKQLFVEPRGQMETFETMLADFYRVVNGKPKAAVQKAKPRGGGKRIAKDQHTGTLMKRQSNSGAAFLAVCRGKVSEGIDFSDKNARLVIVVGIPFPNQKDMQVIMKKQYNNQNKCLLSGDQWYCYQAFRALNQAVGRCIRHRHDYGAIILLDERYKRASNLEYMSKWLRNSIRQVETLEESLRGLKSFFQKFEDTSPPAVSSFKTTVTNDVEKNIASSNQTIAKTTTMTLAKQSQKAFVVEDKENAVCKINQVAAKKRFSKSTQISRFVPEKQQASEGKNHNLRRMMEVESTTVECELALVSKQDRFPLQEIHNQTGDDFDNDPAHLSVSVITLAESPSMEAPCTSSRCCDDDSAQKQASGAKAHQTPSISVISNGSEFCASSLPIMSINSHDTSISIQEKHRLVTPCNLFKEINESRCVLTARNPQTVPSPDPFVRSLAKDFMACCETDVTNGESCDIVNISCETDVTNGESCDIVNIMEGLSPSKHILNQCKEYKVADTEMTIERQDAGNEMSILCFKCGMSLSGALHYESWQKVGMKKKFLSGLLDQDGEYQAAKHVDVLVLELPLLHPLMQGRTSNTNDINQPSESVWVEEDGCVFKPLFCPGCNFKQCIGAYVLAADRMNMKLVDMVLLLFHAVKIIGETGGRYAGEAQCCQNLSTEDTCKVQPFNSSAKRAYQTLTSPWPKLKLPRRD